MKQNIPVKSCTQNTALLNQKQACQVVHEANRKTLQHKLLLFHCRMFQGHEAPLN